jgi:hypothetical protein
MAHLTYDDDCEEQVSDEDACRMLAQLGLSMPSSTEEPVDAFHQTIATADVADEDDDVVKARNILLESTGEALERGNKLARIAAACDAKGQTEHTLEYYNRSIELFVEALGDEVLSESLVSRIILNIEGYLTRCSQLRIHASLEERKISKLVQHGLPVTKKAFEAISHRGGGVLKRGVSLYKLGKTTQARRTESANSGAAVAEVHASTDWTVEVLYTEAIECMLSYLKSDAGKANSNSKPVILKCVSEMLDLTESIRKKSNLRLAPDGTSASDEATPT